MKKLLSLLIASACAGILITLGVSQEVPVGSVHGTIEMAENNRPLPGVLVVLSPAVHAEDDDFEMRNWHVKTDAEGKFSFSRVPSGDYRLEVAAKQHKLKTRVIQIQEGGQAPLELELAPKDPSLQLYSSQKVIAPQAEAKLEITGFTPTDKFSVSVRRLKMEKIAQQGGVSEALQPIAEQRRGLKPGLLDEISEKAYSGEYVVAKKDGEGAFVGPVAIPPLDEGLYFVTVAGGGLSASTYLNVSRLALVTKTVAQTSLCYVADIDSSQPLANIPLSIPTPSGFRILGKTDSSGLATVALHGAEKASLIIGQSGKSVAVADAPMNPPSNDGEETTDPNTRIFTYADRPVYKPGDTIQFKSIVRRLNGVELKLPAPGLAAAVSDIAVTRTSSTWRGFANVRILDDQENLLETKVLPISEHGTIHGDFTTSPEAKPGVYQIEVSALGGVDKYYANLAAYRKPDYSIKVTPKSQRYQLGDQAEAIVECQYFFGGPVVGAKVTAAVYRSPDWGYDNSDDSDDSSPDSEDFSGGQFVQNVEAVTDGTGKATIRFPTAIENSSDGNATDYRYSISASVSSSSGHSFEGSGSLLVTQGSFQLDVSTNPIFLAPHEEGAILVQTKSFDSMPKPVSGVAVQLALDLETYTAHTLVYQPIQTLTVTTDSAGVAKVPIIPSEEGNIRIRATAVDSGGRSIQRDSDLWVDGSPSDLDSSSPKVEVKLDRKRYAVGDTAKVLVSTDQPGGVALLTVESDTIKRHQLVNLQKGSAVVRIPVDKSMSPNAFISVSYVYKRTYSEDTEPIKAARGDKKLIVSVTPDAKKALPGAEVGFQVKTTDGRGKGVKANLSFGLVDESIYAIKKDTTDITRDLYPRKEDLVQTNYSFPEIYLDGGDKGGGSVPVRRKFLDTAAWIPEIETDSAGNAHVKVKIPDNLTSWRATTVAATDDTAVGMATANMIANKPLMVRVTAPQFLVATDIQTLGADITNDSGQPLEVKLAVRASGLQLGSLGDTSFKLGDGETKTIPFPVSTTDSGNGVITATATSDKGFSDAVESKFSILPHARLVETDQERTVTGSQEFKFELSSNRDPHAGSLEVTVTPSIASGLIQSLDQLVQFPYGCVEQTLSRFLPAVRVVKSIRGTPLHRADLDLRSDKIAVDGFARLQKMQHTDGGWGWWTYDDSDPFMTAWVLDGLRIAKDCGKNAPATIDIQKALHWSADRLNKPFKSDSLDAKLYLLLATAEYGRAPHGAAQLSSLDLSKAGIGELSLAALVADKVDDDALRDQILDRVLSYLKADQMESQGKFYWWAQDEELALALCALVTLRPGDPMVGETVVRLRKMRKADGWISTRATTLATLALCDYLDGHPQTVQASQLTLKLNGEPLRTVQIDPMKPDVPDLKVTIPMEKLAIGSNVLAIEDAGGQPYVSASLRQYDVEPELKQVIDDSSLSVQRAYYKMEPTRTEDGSMSLLPNNNPTNQFQSGDIIRCVVTVYCDHPVDFLFVEDPLPSNCRVTDREDPMADEPWDYWWSDLTIMDDRVALFAREMSRGTHQMTYTMRAEGSGTSTALPTHVQDMYVPELSASGAENRLEINP